MAKFKKSWRMVVTIILIAGAGTMSQLKINIASDYIKTPISAIIVGIKKLESICIDICNNFRNYLSSIDKLNQENKHLKEVVAKLTLKQRLAQKIMQENEHLKEILEFKPNNEYKLKIAKIIGFEPNSLADSIIIEKIDGLKVAAACIGYQKNREGLIGRIQSINKYSCRLLLITDKRSMVSGISKCQQIRGILQGDGHKLLKMNYVNRDADIRVGDEIVSAGNGGVFPPFIPIGKVVHVYKGEDFPNIYVKPYINPYQLKEVFVVIPNKS